MSAISCSSEWVKTLPVGLCGVLRIKARVFGVKAAAKRFMSRVQAVDTRDRPIDKEKHEEIVRGTGGTEKIQNCLGEERKRERERERGGERCMSPTFAAVLRIHLDLQRNWFQSPACHLHLGTVHIEGWFQSHDLVSGLHETHHGTAE